MSAPLLPLRCPYCGSALFVETAQVNHYDTEVTGISCANAFCHGEWRADGTPYKPKEVTS